MKDTATHDEAAAPPNGAPPSELSPKLRKRAAIREAQAIIIEYATFLEAKGRNGEWVQLQPIDALQYVPEEVGDLINDACADAEVALVGSTLKARGWQRIRVEERGDDKGTAWVPPQT